MTNIKSWNEIATKMAETVNETVWEYYGHEVRMTGHHTLDVRCPTADAAMLPIMSQSIRRYTNKPVVVSASSFI